MFAHKSLRTSFEVNLQVLEENKQIYEKCLKERFRKEEGMLLNEILIGNLWMLRLKLFHIITLYIFFTTVNCYLFVVESQTML